MKNSTMDSHQRDVEFKKTPRVERIPFAIITLVTKETTTTQQKPLLTISTQIILRWKVLV